MSVSQVSLSIPSPNLQKEAATQNSIIALFPKKAETTKDAHSFSTYGYQEATRRLNAEERSNIARKTEELTEKKAKIIQICQSIAKRDYNNLPFESPDFPYYVLEALRIGKISQLQFGSIMHFWSALQCNRGFNEIEIHNIFLENGMPNPKALELIVQSMSTNGNCEFITDKELEAFVEVMRKVPPSEQCFLIMPHQDFTSDLGETISCAIQKTGVNVFNLIGDKKQMIPSMSMVQQYLNVRCGKDAVRINPVLGLSTVKQMRDVEGSDIGLRFPGVYLPENADGFAGPWYLFTIHDLLYHAVVKSKIPLEHRKMIIYLADIALEILRENSIERNSGAGQTLHALYEAAIDMESRYYGRVNFSEIVLEVKFWLSVKDLALKVYLNKSYELFDIQTLFVFYRKLVEKLVQEKEGERLGLNLETLKQAWDIRNSHIAPMGSISDIKPLSIMLDHLQPSLNTLTYVDPERELEILENKRFLWAKDNPEMKRRISEEKELLLEDMRHELSCYPIIWLTISDFPLGKLADLEGSLRLEILENVHSFARLLNAGISFEQFKTLAPKKRQEILQYSFFVSSLLKKGFSFEQVLSLISTQQCGHLKNVAILAMMGASYQDFEDLSETRKELLSPIHTHMILLLAQRGLTYTTLKEMEEALLRKILGCTESERLILLAIPKLNKIVRTKAKLLKLILEKEFYIQRYLEVGLSLKQFCHMNSNELQHLLDNPLEYMKLFRSKIDLEKILTSPHRVDIVRNSHLISQLTGLGFTFEKLADKNREQLSEMLSKKQTYRVKI